ncbi:auxin efflux carrier [Cubamyces menziesii]|nr:auxin efflux carrier [Cubamyces menziesii]
MRRVLLYRASVHHVWSLLVTTYTRAFGVGSGASSLEAHTSHPVVRNRSKMAVSAALLIYNGVMPLIKTFAALLCGYVLVRLDMFPPAASRGASIISMNVALPALIFANVVPSFTPSNVSALGPVILIASIYMISGFLMGIIIREICYVPRNFWQGIVIMTGMSNWGNLPNAIVLSVTQQPPFNPATDPALGVSYVSIFTVCYHVIFWIGGGAHSLSWDYLPGVPQGEEAERRISWKERPIGHLIAKYILRLPATPSTENAGDASKDEESLSEKQEKASVETFEIPVPDVPKTIVSEEAPSDSDIQLTRRTSRISAVTGFRSRRPSNAVPPSPVLLRITVPSAPLRVTIPAASLRTTAPTSPLAGPPPPTPLRSVSIAPSKEQKRVVDDSPVGASITIEGKPSLLSKVLHRLGAILRPFKAILHPVTVAISISLPVALVQPLKALFVDVSSQGGPSWHGPDGRPPLAFVMDTAQFIDTIAVPLALILLGASFARITVPHPFSRLPIMAILLVTAAKMIVLPVMGVFIVQAMTRKGLIPQDARAEKFVSMLLSGTPAAVNQMIVSSLHAPDGNVDTIAAFYLAQYVFMIIGSSALTAVSLLLV